MVGLLLAEADENGSRQPVVGSGRRLEDGRQTKIILVRTHRLAVIDARLDVGRGVRKAAIEDLDDRAVLCTDEIAGIERDNAIAPKQRPVAAASGNYLALQPSSVTATKPRVSPPRTGKRIRAPGGKSKCTRNAKSSWGRFTALSRLNALPLGPGGTAAPSREFSLFI